MSDTTTVRRLRTGATGVLVVLACVAMLASVLGLWVRAVALDSDRFARTGADAMTTPEVADVVGRYVAGEAVQIVTELVEVDLPGKLEPFAEAFTGSVQDTIARNLAEHLASDTAHAVVETSLRRAHGSLLRVLDGDGDAVTINLLPLLGEGLRRVQDLGLIPTDVALPELERGGDPADQIAVLESLIGRDLGEEFGQFTIYRGDDVAGAGEVVSTASDAVALLRRATTAVVLVTLAVTLLAVGVLTLRRRTLIQLALGFTVTMIAASLVIDAVRDRLPVSVEPEARDGAAEVFTRFTLGLLRFARLVAILAALIGSAVWLSRDVRAQRRRAP